MRLIGPALFVVSAITSVFLTPSDVTNSIINFGVEHSPFHSSEVLRIHEKNSLEESTSYLEDRLKALDPQLTNSNLRIKELEQETETKDEQLLTLLEHYNKLKSENANLFAQLSKSKNGLAFSTSWAVYFFRGFSLLVMLIFFAGIVSYFRRREKQENTPTVMPCICDDGNPPEEEQLKMNKLHAEEVASSKPLRSSRTTLTEELSHEMTPTSQECIGEVTTIDAYAQMDTQAVPASEAPIQSLPEDELVKGSAAEDALSVASSELTTQVPKDSNHTSNDEQDSKDVLLPLDEEEFYTNEPDVTGSYIDRHIAASEPNPLLQSFVNVD